MLFKMHMMILTFIMETEIFCSTLFNLNLLKKGESKYVSK